jgi:sigma-B regulation protein RsbU (phosphoserine phosphatase)
VKLLVAEDDTVIRRLLQVTLSRSGFEVVAVANGRQALEEMQKPDAPRLAVLDWMMPNVEGAEVCRRIRIEMPLANMYLMLLTSLETKGHVIAGLDAGADDYLVKPFDPDDLRARINVGMRVLSLQERLAERVKELQDALANVKVLHGLLPICSYCKRIRGDDQYWTQVESYIADRSEATFSHGICPPCANELEKEIEEHNNNRAGGR